MISAAVLVIPDDLARAVDAVRGRAIGGEGIVEGGENVDWYDPGSSVIATLPEAVGATCPQPRRYSLSSLGVCWTFVLRREPPLTQ